MNDVKWFLLNDGQVTGPFSKEDVSARASPGSGVLIWGRGLADWVQSERWNQILKEGDGPARQGKLLNDRLWKLKMAGQELKPMSHDRMIDFLKTQTDYSDIQIWTDGYTDWKDIYQIHKIMDELGVSRRLHPRVPIMGTLQCEGATGNLTARILSISEGGLGITDAPKVKIGEKFKITLKSPNLFTPILAMAEVVYVGTENYAGMKFSGLQPESKSAIIEYVKKFTDVKKKP